MAIALQWNHNKVNLRTTDRRVGDEVSHVIFTVDEAGDVVPIQDKRIDKNDYYLSILRHGTLYKHEGDYAAMLELL